EAVACLQGREDAWYTPDVLDIKHRVDVLALASNKQQEEVERLRKKFARAVCEDRRNREQYIAIQRRILAAVEQLAECNQEEADSFDELSRVTGSVGPFRSMRVASVGLKKDPQSLATLHRRELEQFVPQALQ